LLLNTNNSENYISSVSWLNYCKSNCLAVGFADNTIQLWDTEKFQPLRSLLGHRARVSSLSWNNWILSSGGRDTLILNHDVRIPNNIVSQFSGHTAEVCGLKWSENCSQLASGGNDNNIYIWGLDNSSPKQCFSEHKAAVKGLSWCPWQKNLLASGGGTADKSMKFWDTEKGKLLHSVSAESQVCSIVWNKFDKEVVSGHGYSRNQLCVWKYGTFDKVAELRGHTSRVLHLALSPDGSTVCSAGADETLRFWKVFESGDESNGKHKGDSLQNGDFNLR
jgi:cell division cycle 20, cofactor of APC complex